MAEVLAVALARPLSPAKLHVVNPTVAGRRPHAKVLPQHRRGGAA
jgi:hypothetical protein